MRARIRFNPRRLFGIDWDRANGLTHVWICLIPTLPIELVFGRDSRLLRNAPLRAIAHGRRRSGT